jgi:hypothetical protein
LGQRQSSPEFRVQSPELRTEMADSADEHRSDEVRCQMQDAGSQQFRTRPQSRYSTTKSQRTPSRPSRFLFSPSLCLGAFVVSSYVGFRDPRTLEPVDGGSR